VLEVGDDFVRVQPGIVHAQLNEILRPLGRHFGPDPAMSSVTTMGSVVAVDSGGSHWLKYGSARRHVRSLQIVLSDGDVLEVGRESLFPPAEEAESVKAALVRDVTEVLRRNADLIEAARPRSAVNRAGYHLDVLSDDQLDLPGLLTGSEGTLAVISEITLGTEPLPRHRGVALLFFDRLENAARAVLEILPLGASACDLMDRRHLSLARESTVQYDLLIPPQTEAALLVGRDGAPEDLCDALLARGVGTVAMTLGAAGCLVATRESKVAIPSIQVEAVDTTAAGDAFNGALALFLAQGMELEQAVSRANRAGALAATKHGAQASLPLMAELMSTL